MLRPAGDFGIAPDGSIPGVQGVLDQATSSLVTQLIPVIQTQILPALQNDRQLQYTIGQGAGSEIAKPLWVATLLVGAYLAYRIIKD